MHQTWAGGLRLSGAGVTHRGAVAVGCRRLGLGKPFQLAAVLCNGKLDALNGDQPVGRKAGVEDGRLGPVD